MLKKAYKNDSNIEIKSQQSYINQNYTNEEAKTKFTDWLGRNPGYQNIIDEIRIRPEK